MPTLPPRRNTLPGKVSPWLFDTSAFNLMKPSRLPPKRSTAWMSILRSTYGSLWNSCEGCSCRARDCCRVVIQTLKAGNETRSFWLRSGMLFTLRFKLEIVNVDILTVFDSALVMLIVGLCVGMGCVCLRFRVARRSEFINSDWVRLGLLIEKFYEARCGLGEFGHTTHICGGSLFSKGSMTSFGLNLTSFIPELTRCTFLTSCSRSTPE